MKTKSFILTLLVLIIHVVVISQPSNQAFDQNKQFVLGYAHYTEQERKEFSTVDDPSVLLIQAKELVAESKKTKQEAYFKDGKVQNRTSIEAEQIVHEADVRRLAAAELQAYNNKLEFKLMKESFIDLLSYYDKNDTTVIRAKKNLANAIRSYQSATLMREEAYAQQTTEAIIGNLYNAEELEFNSIVRITQGMKLLEKVPARDVASK
jgi:hypothetical protein